VFTALIKGGYPTIGHLTRVTRQQLLDVYDIGPKSVDEIVRALSDRGLGLSEPQGALSGT
jgi:DNA-directed RNA polymerase alpha subunit